MHLNAAPTPALGSNALLMPGLMWEPSAPEIKSAMETVNVADAGEAGHSCLFPHELAAP